MHAGRIHLMKIAQQWQPPRAREIIDATQFGAQRWQPVAD
jgi:hypothetical protein